MDDVNGYACDCAPGFTGTTCQTGANTLIKYEFGGPHLEFCRLSITRNKQRKKTPKQNRKKKTTTKKNTKSL